MLCADMRATRAEIKLPNFYHNLAYFRARLVKTKLCLAVKGNAYGHGLVELSRRSTVDAFAVATIEEGAALRQAGIRKPILLLGPHLRQEVPQLCELELEPLLSHGSYLPDYQREAVKHNLRLRLHLKVDTGLCRGGVQPHEVLKIAQLIRASPALELYGLCTHFSSADTDPIQTRAQFDCFQQVLQQFHEQNITLPCVHAANSVATLHYPEAHFDMVRIGIGAYGYCHEDLLPVLSLKTKIGLLKKVTRGSKVSYGGTWEAPRDSLLALLPIGYADGYSRLLSNQGQVLLQGELCPLVGRVCMDQVIVDITEWARKHSETGGSLLEEDVELFGSRFSAQHIATQIGTIPYEVLTSITARVPRIYLN